MNCSKNQLYLTAAAFMLSSALAIDWVAGIWLNTQTWVVRSGMLGTGLMISGAAVGMLCAAGRRSDIAARKYLELLCRLDYHELNSEATEVARPKVHNSDKYEILDRVRAALLKAGERVQEVEQARSALELRARRNETRAERVEAILQALPEPVLAIDKFDELVLTNPSADRLFHIDTESGERRALAQLVHCESLVNMLTETRRRKAPSQRMIEMEIADADGQHRWFSVTARSMNGGENSPDGSQGVVAVLRDISSQKASQKRNAEFVSAVSHEMKTPLAGIKAYVELLVDGDAEDEETQEEFLNVINSQANRLQRLVDNLLNLARIEAGVVSVSKESRSLNEILEEALRICQPAAERKDITLASDLSPMYLGVLVDRDMMMQAAMNLLSNAIKYTPDGGRVTLRSRMNDNEIRFDVIDTGVGLSSEDCHKVFEKFYRVQKQKDMAAGTGLGLPLAKHIVEDVHGGKLVVESALGHGSTFSVILPSAGSREGLTPREKKLEYAS